MKTKAGGVFLHRFFQFDFKKLLLLLFVIAVPLLSINMQKKPGEPSIFLKPFSSMVGLVQNVYLGFSGGVQDTMSRYIHILNVKSENLGLEKENGQLKARQSLFNELRLENERLNGLLGFKNSTNMELIAARVTGLDLFGERSTIRINKGQKESVHKGMAVVTSSGVVGYVYNSEKYSSQVLVLADRYAVIDARVQRTRARGVVEGYTLGLCKLKYLRLSDDVKQGDIIVTSGLDDIFPKGFPIGEVTLVEKKNYGITQKVQLKPIVDPQLLEEVFIVKNTLGFDAEKIKEIEKNEPSLGANHL
jgi:rod shape-determining protein MreC